MPSSGTRKNKLLTGNVKLLHEATKKGIAWGNLAAHPEYAHLMKSRTRSRNSKSKTRSKSKSKSNSARCNAAMQHKLTYKDGHGAERQITIQDALQGCLSADKPGKKKCKFYHQGQRPTTKGFQEECRFSKLKREAIETLRRICPECKVGGSVGGYTPFQTVPIPDYVAERINLNPEVVIQINKILDMIKSFKKDEGETYYQELLNLINMNLMGNITTQYMRAHVRNPNIYDEFLELYAMIYHTEGMKLSEEQTHDLVDYLQDTYPSSD